MDNKAFIASIIITLLFASLVVFTVAYGQTILSVPEFSLKFEELPYDVPPVYQINQYTGKNVTVREGYHAIKQIVTITIKNQPFVSSYNGDQYYLYYNIRSKGHFGEDWIEFYSDEYHGFSPNTYNLDLPSGFLSASASDFTEAIQSVSYPSGAKVDFQVEAIVWRGFQYFVPDTYLVPTPAGHYEQRYAFYGTSGWSNTQTLTIDTNSPQSPLISILSPTNTTYSAVYNPYITVPLIFATNTSLSWVGYSLDGGSNVTVTNETLIEIHHESRSLTLYANDTAGNWAAPQTVYYDIAFNLGYPPAQPFPILLVVAISAAVVAVVGVGVLVYFKKRKH